MHPEPEDLVRHVLEVLGVALTEHNHQWTAEERRAWDAAYNWATRSKG